MTRRNLRRTPAPSARLGVVGRIISAGHQAKAALVLVLAALMAFGPAQVRAQSVETAIGLAQSNRPAYAFGQATGGQRHNDLNYGDPTHGPYMFEANRTLYNTTYDPILTIGYNMGYASNRIKSTEPSAGWRVEGDYDNGTSHDIEVYWEAFSSDGLIDWRPIGFIANRAGTGTARTTFIKSLDLYGPGPTTSRGGIAFFAAKDGADITVDEQTYLFKRAALQIQGFSDANTVINAKAGTGKTAGLLLGYGGTDDAIHFRSANASAGDIGSASLAGFARFQEINSGTGFGISINDTSNQASLIVNSTGTFTATGVAILKQKTGGTGKVLDIQDGSGNPQGGFDKNGRLSSTGTAPALTSCGTSPTITGGDNAFTITEGSTASGCTATFAVAFAATPSCVPTSQDGLGFTYAVSTSAVTITNVGALSSKKIDVVCVGH